MSHFEFAVPIQRKDLLEAREPGHYVVRHVLEPPDLRSSVHELVVALSTDRGEFVLDKFDLVYSALVHFSSLEAVDREQIWETVNKGYGYLSSDLTELLDQPCLDSELRTKYLNLLKMSTYLLCQLAEAFEALAQRPSDVLTTGKGKRGRRPAEDDLADWDAQRMRVLRQLFVVLRLQLRRLWDPPVPDEDFVNVIGNVCYHFLALPSVGHVRNKPLRDAIFQVLGELVRSYGHSLSCSLKIPQMLEQYEHAPAPLAQGVVTIATECGGRDLVNKLVRELASADGEGLARDTAARRYGEFLSLVAAQAPDLVLTNMCLLIVHLDGESYQMRNAVLSILGDMVSQVLSGEELSDRQKRQRNEFLEYLHDHMHDVNAFVRTKVLQIWQRLVLDGCVPLTRHRVVLRRAVGRLQDKASSVRRAALQLLKALLQANPFAVQLSVARLEEQYATEKAKLIALGVEEDVTATSNDYDDDDDEEEGEKDVLLLALSAARSSLVSALNSAAAGGAPKETQKKRQKLLKLLQSGRCIEDESAAALMMTEPGLVPGLAPVTTGPAAAGAESPGGSSQEAEASSGHSAPEAPLSREALARALQVLADTGADSDDQAKQIEIDKQRLMVLYFRDSVAFARLVDQSIPDICQFLHSSQVTDILEAIHFFVTAFQFGLLKAMAGIGEMLSLIWSKETVVKEAVVDAYKQLYIPSEGNERFRASRIVRNFSALCENATAGQLEALEQLVVQLVGSGHMGDACVQLLWQTFTGAGVTETAEEPSTAARRAALQLIAMVAGAEASVVSANLDVLVEHGLRAGADGTPSDLRTVRYVCAAALKIAPRKVSAEDDLPPPRMSPDHQLFVRLSDILVTGLENSADVYYAPMAQAAVDTIYQLSDTPDMVMGSVLRRMAAQVTAAGSRSGVVARWLAVLGHTAVRQMIHLDVHVFTELKRRNRLRQRLTAGRHPPTAADAASQSISSASSTPARRKSQEGEGDGEGDESMTGAAADDAEAEYIQNLCEHHVVSGDGMLATYLPLLVEINSHPDHYPDRKLRTAAALALAKFMVVSSVVCEQHLQLLFTVLERSTDDVIRSNTIVLLGDMSFRFPNLIEPWTPNIYARLRDDSVIVRRTTLRVLTHLILNDMVKVKGQISDVAERIVDAETGLRDLARAFFAELAQKGNALYNVLPDIVSRLSDPTVGLGEDDFRAVLQYVLGLIQKDRQVEPLVEKLCHRLRAAAEPRQWRDLAFCLSLLNYSDRCVKKLLENFTCFAEKLHEKDVYECFTKIVAASKKAAKSAEARVACDELESRLREAHLKAVEDENAAAGAERAGKQRDHMANPRHTQKGGGGGGKKGPDLTPRRSALSAQRRGPRTRLPSSSSEAEEPAGDSNSASEDEAGDSSSAGEDEAGDSSAAGEDEEDKENVPEPAPAQGAGEPEQEKRRRPAATRGRQRAARGQPPPPAPPAQRSTRRRR